MTQQFIDYTKLGYRWKGDYNAATTYINYDVVAKEGGVYSYLNGAWVIFTEAQQAATTKGEVVTNSLSGGVTGTRGTSLHSKEDTVEFRHSGERSGTKAIKLMRHIRPSESYTYAYYHGAIMSDGTLRVWGLQTGGQSGLGNITASNMQPCTVPMPKGKNVVDAFSLGLNIYIIDQDGVLYACGADPIYGGWAWNSDYGVAARYKITDISKGTDMEGKKITFMTGDLDQNIGDAKTVMYAQDDAGAIYSWGVNANGQCGRDGVVTPQYKPTKITTLANGLPMPAIRQKHIFPACTNTTAVYVIDTLGKLYSVGAANWALSTKNEYEGFVEYIGIPGNTYSLVRMYNSDYHVTAGVQNMGRRMVLDTTGRGWVGGNNPTGTNDFAVNPVLPLPTIGGAGQVTSDDGQKIFGGAAAYGGNVAGVNVGGFVDLHGRNGGYGSTYGLTAQGEIWSVGAVYGSAFLGGGASQLNGSGTGAGGGFNKIKFSTENGVDQTNKHLHAGNDVFSKSKFHVHGQNYGRTMSSLTTDGYMYVWGRNELGQAGIGHNTPTDIDPGLNQTDGIPAMAVPEKIVDYDIAGNLINTSNNLNFALLGEDGNVYTVGAGLNQMNNEDDSANCYVPKKVLF